MTHTWENSCTLASRFYDVRVRNADVGMHLWASGVNHAFVNSNTWVHGAVSGGGFSYGILAEGPGANNNNIFIGEFINFALCTVHIAASKRVVTRNRHYH